MVLHSEALLRSLCNKSIAVGAHLNESVDSKGLLGKRQLN